MEHIPAVLRRMEQVPHKARNAYDNKGFFGYPRREGWDKVLNGSDFSSEDPEKFVSFLQTWLFFGLLAECLEGVEWKTADFIRTSDYRLQYITTDKLPAYLEQWRVRAENLQRKALYQHMTRVELVLDEAKALVSKYCSVENVDDESIWPIDPMISLSFMVLGETLAYAKSKILEKTNCKTPGWYDENVKGGWGNSKLISERLKESGWCAHSVQMLQELMNSQVCGLYYVSSFRPPNNTHHDDCTASECKVESKSYYEAKHTKAHCNCKPLGPSVESLASIVERGGIPLLTYSKTATTAQVSVVQYEKNMKYVTFSHVWADGLCNPKENSLTQCHVEFLNALALKLLHRSPVTFWIDTLAIPVGDQHRRVRDLAIRDMHRVYTLAEKAIVLDSDLMSERQGNDYIETAMRITTSRWMRRVWTLQEGFLSKDLYFKFYDGLVGMEGLEDLFRSHKYSLQSSVPDSARSYYRGLLGSERQRYHELVSSGKESEINRKRLIAPVWKATQWRKMSHPHQETLAIATLLRIDPKQLLQVSGNSQQSPADGAQELQKFQGLVLQMRLLLSKLDNFGAIPPGMIFLPGPRLPQRGYGWAPQTWMGRHKVDYPDPLALCGEDASLFPQGLMVRYPGFKLHSSEKEVRQQVWPLKKDALDQIGASSVEDKEWFWFPSNKLLLEWYAVRNDAATNGSNSGDKLPSQEILQGMDLALILPRRVRSATPEISLLVAVNEEQDQLLYVRILARVWVSIETRQDRIRALQDDFKENRTIIFGEALRSDQRWCVDGWNTTVSRTPSPLLPNDSHNNT
jgi:hypothetical protein